MKIKLFMCGGEKPVSEIPLGIGYLLTNVTGHKLEVTKNVQELKDCDWIGISSTAWGVAHAIDITKGTKIPVVIGGQGVLYDSLGDHPFKHIVRGPGEVVLQSILDGHTHPQRIPGTNPRNIDNIKFPERGKCTATVPILTSRGCPFDCHFCSSQIYWDRASYHSADYMMEEVKHLLKRYPHMKVLYILDDLFISKKRRFLEIHEKWMKAGYHKRLKLKCFVRAKMFTFEVGQKLKQMGFESVRFGAESGSNRMLKLLNKMATVEDNQEVIDIGNRLGLPVQASFMKDLPGETPADAKMTDDFIKRNRGKMKVQGHYKFRPFPGTKYYAGEAIETFDMRVR